MHVFDLFNKVKIHRGRFSEFTVIDNSLFVLTSILLFYKLLKLEREVNFIQNVFAMGQNTETSQ